MRRTPALQLLLFVVFIIVCAQPLDWLRFLNRAGTVIHAIETTPIWQQFSKIDFTGGATIISAIPGEDINILQNISNYHTASDASTMQLLADTAMSPMNLSPNSPLMSLSPASTRILNAYNARKPGLLKVHQLGRSAAKRVPDVLLIGVLALVATELIQREVNRQSSIFPPVVRELANRTMFELDDKLELLTALQWNFEPFLQGEMDNLQTQPVEMLDKYVVSELLLKVDKDFSPFLSKLIADPQKVKELTQRLKEVVQLATVLFLQPGRNNNYYYNNNNNQQFNSNTNNIEGNNNFDPTSVSDAYKSIQKTTSLLLENVDILSTSLETAVIEWNRLIEEVGKVMKADGLLQYIAKTKQLQSSIIDVEGKVMSTKDDATNIDISADSDSNQLSADGHVLVKGGKVPFFERKSWKLLWGWPFPPANAVSSSNSTKNGPRYTDLP